MEEMPHSFSSITGAVIGAGVGIAGGLLAMTAEHASSLPGPVIGASFGALFGFVFASRSVNPGAGLIWGLGYSFLLRLLLPVGILPLFFGQMVTGGMLPTARSHFPELIAYIDCFGLPWD